MVALSEELKKDEFRIYPGSPDAARQVLAVARLREVPCDIRQDDGGRPYITSTSGERMYQAAIRALAMMGEKLTCDGSFQFAHSFMLGARSPSLYYHYLHALEQGLEGDVAECGVFYAETAREMARFLAEANILRRIHLFDTFTGFPNVATEEESSLNVDDDPWWLDRKAGGLPAPLKAARRHMHPYNLWAKWHVGPFSETFAEFDVPLCFIHADADLYQSTVEIIEMADRLLVPGGRIVFDDYGDQRFPGVQQAVAERLDPGKYRLEPVEGIHQAVAIKRGA